jgi:hypothetical protein
MVLAKSWRGTTGENIFDGRTSFKLAANNFGLPVDAAKG